MKSNTKRTLLKLAAGTLATICLPLHAQEYPSRPITLVVPFAIGGATDITARRFGDGLSKELGTPVVIENKPGAGSFAAVSHVIRSAKDGYTLLFAGTGTISLNPLIYKSMPYDPADLLPVSTVSKQAFALNANVDLPVKSVNEFVDYVRSRPDGVEIGTVGTGTTSHILAEWIARTLDVKMNAVPYKGTSASTIDLMSGRIAVQIDGITTARTMHDSGKTRILAAMGEEQSPLPQGVPNFKDVGYPDLLAYAEFGLIAPTGTPDAVVRKLYAATVKVVAMPEFRQPLLSNGEIPVASESPEAYAAQARSDIERWKRIVAPMNLQFN